MALQGAARRRWRILQRGSLLVGLGAGALCALGAFVDTPRFFEAYLLAFLFWSSIGLGCLGLLLLHHLAGGPWGFPIQRLLAAGARTLPLLALLFVPLLFGLRTLYPWADGDLVAADPLLRHKSAYLNVPFFLVRAALYFLSWSGLALLTTWWSYQYDETGEVMLLRWAQRLSAPGLILYVLTGTFAAFDWAMSLDPHWYSTIYGLLLIAGQLLAALALAIALLWLLHDEPPLARTLTPRTINDLGSLLLVALTTWAYLAFTQFLVIWAGNLPEEVVWYVARTRGGWQWVALALVVLHFALPAAILLLREAKRKMRLLAALALFVLLLRLLAVYWLVMPSFSPQIVSPHWLDAAAPAAVGGLWLATFAWQVGRHQLLADHYYHKQEERGAASHAS